MLAPRPMPRSARPGGYPTDFMSQLNSGLGRNANSLIGLGSGLLSGQDFAQGLAAGGQGWMQGQQVDDAYATSQKAETQRQEQMNQTVQAMLEAGREDLANMAEAGQMDLAWQGYLEHVQSQNQSVKPMEINGQLVDPATGQVLGDYRTNGGAGSGVEYGVNPVYGRLPDGTMGMGVIGKDGTLKRIESEGFQPLGPYDTNALKAAGTAFGKGTGQAQFDVPAAELTMKETMGAIQDIKDNKAGMEEQFGNILGVPQQLTPAWPGSQKANFQNAVSRGADQAFLQAREMLRGGGQITDFEGRKAENAITNMTLAMERGDKAAFEKALTDFELAVQAGYQKLLEQASTMPTYGGGPQQVPGGGNVTSTGVPWSVEP